MDSSLATEWDTVSKNKNKKQANKNASSALSAQRCTFQDADEQIIAKANEYVYLLCHLFSDPETQILSQPGFDQKSKLNKSGCLDTWGQMSCREMKKKGVERKREKAKEQRALHMEFGTTSINV